MKPIHSHKQQGFSLLEILIAFSILAFSLGILLKIFSGGVNTAMVSEDYTVAVQIAEGLMARSGTEIPLVPSQESGLEHEKYEWGVTISPFVINVETLDPASVSATLFKVKVIVSWATSKEHQRQVELTTIKLAGQKI